MKIVSLLLGVHPDRVDPVREALLALPGVRLHGEAGACRLVVTIEDENGADPMASVLAAQGLPGVLSTTLTYEFCDDDETVLPEKRQ